MHGWFMTQFNHVALLCAGCAQLQFYTWIFSRNTFVYGFIEKCSIAVSQFWISMCYQNESQPLHVWFMIQYNHVALLWLGCAQLQLDTWNFSGNTFVYGFIEKCSLAVSQFWISMCYQNESQPLHVWFMIQYNHVALLWLGCAQLQLDTWNFSRNKFVYGFIEKCSIAVSQFWISMW